MNDPVCVKVARREENAEKSDPGKNPKLFRILRVPTDRAAGQEGAKKERDRTNQEKRIEFDVNVKTGFFIDVFKVKGILGNRWKEKPKKTYREAYGEERIQEHFCSVVQNASGYTPTVKPSRK